MKVYLDENLSPRVAQLLRERGIDAVSAHEVGNAGLDDRAQLRYAATAGRALVTADIVDFLQLEAETIAANAPHAGIILLSPGLRHQGFDALARAIEKLARPYPVGAPQMLLYLGRGPRDE